MDRAHMIMLIVRAVDKWVNYSGPMGRTIKISTHGFEISVYVSNGNSRLHVFAFSITWRELDCWGEIQNVGNGVLYSRVINEIQEKIPTKYVMVASRVCGNCLMFQSPEASTCDLAKAYVFSLGEALARENPGHYVAVSREYLVRNVQMHVDRQTVSRLL